MAKSAETFLDLINIIDNVPHEFDFSTLYRLVVGDDIRPHGIMDPSVVAALPWSSDFRIDHASRTVQLKPAGVEHMGLDEIREACNAAFQETIDKAIYNKSFPILTTHSEMYRLMATKNLVLERFAVPLFGIAGRGAHMTAFVRTLSGLKLWVPRRAKHLVTYPGMLDTTVAGGVKADQSPLECIIAESNEEASLPFEFVQQNARPVGVITHCLKSKRSGLLSTAVLYLYDIELSEGMIPKPGDDEVEGFELMSVKEVKAAMFRQEFKPNSSLVMMDFFIRHGIMTEDKDIGYAEIAARLRRRLPVAITPKYS